MWPHYCVCDIFSSSFSKRAYRMYKTRTNKRPVMIICDGSLVLLQSISITFCRVALEVLERYFQLITGQRHRQLWYTHSPPMFKPHNEERKGSVQKEVCVLQSVNTSVILALSVFIYISRIIFVSILGLLVYGWIAVSFLWLCFVFIIFT